MSDKDRAGPVRRAATGCPGTASCRSASGPPSCWKIHDHLLLAAKPRTYGAETRGADRYHGSIDGPAPNRYNDVCRQPTLFTSETTLTSAAEHALPETADLA